MNLTQVIQGLKQGHSYKREVVGIRDTLKPIGDGMVLHSVYNPRTGAGGEAQVPIGVLGLGRWPEDRWELIR